MLLKFISVMLYLVMENGAAETRFEQKAYDTLAQCEAGTMARIAEQTTKSNFLDGLFAACLQLPVREA